MNSYVLIMYVEAATCDLVALLESTLQIGVLLVQRLLGGGEIDDIRLPNLVTEAEAASVS